MLTIGKVWRVSVVVVVALFLTFYLTANPDPFAQAADYPGLGNVKPVALGRVSVGGELVSGTKNIVSVGFNESEKAYEIRVANVPLDAPQYIALITPLGASPAIATTETLNGSMMVHMHDTTGATTLAPFNFVVYRLSGKFIANDPSEEVCDGVDNDLDGDEDEGFPLLGQPCDEGEGICNNTGTFVCSDDGMTVYCSAVPGSPADEVCDDGLDNDCDGEVDEACGGPETPETLCNGIDDDGDGMVDDGFNLGEICMVGVGACENEGHLVCNAQGDGTTCSVEPLSGVPETCNGVDDDCDGTVDEDLPTVDCTAGVGACVDTAPEVCVEGAWVCTAEPFPAQQEVCNGIDDDCDGQTDNNLSLGTCSEGVGACAVEGPLVCLDGQVECTVMPGQPSAEVCGDGVDNDCDGEVDDGCTP